ncbi:MAG: TetR/AcrR family transcriptional regulator [Candidatus Sulfotelmatobacter sp.]
MPTLKDRIKNSTADRILEAAVQLFSRQGYTGSSTHEIARLAGVSEVTVFRHFPRKRDLFWAAAESRLQRLRMSRDLRSRLESDEDPRSVLPGIIELVVEIVYQQPETLRLLYLSLFELDHGAGRILRKHLVPLFQPLHEYLCRCSSKGLIRDIDPGLAAICLPALVAAHRGFQSVLSRDQSPTTNTDDVIASYTSFWVTAMLSEFVSPEANAL